ncbi:MAG: cytochrome d ubiquinol oxidase subunit II [Desulfobacterales bacterium]|nr:MAG: cytochrome d ubiquinol oxidase subunit II [Desulfobacterales bacterium]
MELQIIWFFLWGLLWAIFFMTDGFDFGIGALIPFLARSETDKKQMIDSMGPLWDGNEVWLITAGGVTFAAFPALYATMFSSFYSALMFILFALIFRGVAMEFRNLLADDYWKNIWDLAIFIGSILPAILFGVAFANIFQGVPIDAHGVYHGNLFTLINTYGLIGGLFFLALFLEHGALWLVVKTTGDLEARCVKIAGVLWWAVLVMVLVFLAATWFHTRLFANYLASPLLLLLPAMIVAALWQVRVFTGKRKAMHAWLSMAVVIMGCTFFGVIGLFPAMLPTNIEGGAGLTAFNASSSPLTLKIMLVVTIIFIPLVIGYQIWAYRLFSGKVETGEENAGGY